MSDFSYFSLFTAGLACLVPFTTAYTQPKGDAPVGNPFSQPGLNSVVPAGKEFVVTWEPTTKGTVTLVLLKGPSSNAVPQYAIAEKIDNTGTYTWKVADDLAPSSADTPAQGYGLELIVDATGQYQYTTQFGISNPKYKKSGSSSSSSSSSSKATESIASAPPAYTPAIGIISSSSSSKPPASFTTTSSSESSTSTESTTKPVAIISTPHPSPSSKGPTSYPVHNVTMVAPTGYVHTLKTTSTGASSASGTPTTTKPGAPVQQTGAASTFAGGAFGAVVMAGLAAFAL